MRKFLLATAAVCAFAATANAESVRMSVVPITSTTCLSPLPPASATTRMKVWM